jgi:hypothetical protein
MIKIALNTVKPEFFLLGSQGICREEVLVKETLDT